MGVGSLPLMLHYPVREEVNGLHVQVVAQ
jgi:hypothetical protein